MRKINLKQTCYNVFLLTAIVIFAAVNITFLKSYTPDSDTFFLITTGKNIVETGKVATINPFTFHENFEIIIQQWLFDVMLYKIYDIFGFFGIYLYSALMTVITLVAVYKFFGLYSKNKELKALCLIIFSLTYYCVARPTSISFLMCLSIVAILKKYQDNNNKKLLLFLPLISLITINVHSAMWPMLFVLIVPFIFPDSIPKNIKQYTIKWFNKNKFILLSIVSMFLTGFVNPNGINSMLYSIKSYGAANLYNRINELKSPEAFSYYGLMIAVTIGCFLLYLQAHKEKINFSLFYMSCGTILLAAMHIRNSWFLTFSLYPLFLTQDIKIPKLFTEKTLKNKSEQILSLIISCALMLGVAALPIVSEDIILKDKTTQPVLAVEYLDKLNKDDIVLFTTFNNGAFFEFYDYKVYIDARPEIYQEKINKQEDIYTEYTELMVFGKNIKGFLDKYNFTHLIAEEGTPLYGYLEASNDYDAVVVGNYYRLFEKCN